jgi:hypothetical protein
MRIFDIRDNGTDAALKFKVFGTEVLGLDSVGYVSAGLVGRDLRNRDIGDLVAEISGYASRQVESYNRINGKLKHKPCNRYSIEAAAVFNHGFEVVFKLNQ